MLAVIYLHHLLVGRHDGQREAAIGVGGVDTERADASDPLAELVGVLGVGALGAVSLLVVGLITFDKCII